MYHNTSLSLRKKSHRRIKAALHILARHGIHWSESEILTRLAKDALGRWRSHGGWTKAPRRYNIDDQKYVIRPWRVKAALYRILWQRTIHSGESVSRFVDFAIRVYIPQLVERMLHKPRRESAFSARSFGYWARRYARRRKIAAFFINYQNGTEKNAGCALKTGQEAIYIPAAELSHPELVYALRYYV